MKSELVVYYKSTGISWSPMLVIHWLFWLRDLPWHMYIRSEGLVAKKMTEAAAARGVLPQEQMGNRAGRSTELAARVVIETTKAAWEKRLTTSLLQLDLEEAFDNENHEWLLATLASQGWPTWKRDR